MSSKTVLGHLLRGVVGFGLLAIALLYGGDIGWWALMPAGGALFCLRGCPMCWFVGLIATVLDRKGGASCGI